uniref:Uncharacterized protein TCIL3000_10_12970 n=1 Tax=Trypanosoma congolense (strain IL3000) TaxID=1068625 RepID=G0UYP8_TRYCI|nr:unnamed protein product [Trypanosoma congolense IL3000]
MDGSAIPAHFARLPAAEHALLLNRFKFLNMVQRIAAADVAEMIDTVGLEALLFKGTLENIPLATCSPKGALRNSRGKGPLAARGVSRGYDGGQQSGNAFAHQVSAGGARRRRFESTQQEKAFVNRLARPRSYRPLLDIVRERPPPGDLQQDTPLHSALVPANEAYPVERAAAGGACEENVDFGNGNPDLYGDDVVVDSNDEQLQSYMEGAENIWKPGDQSGQMNSVKGGNDDEKNRSALSMARFVNVPPSNGVGETNGQSALKADNGNAPSILLKGSWVRNQSTAAAGQSDGRDAALPSGINSARRVRGSFAPKTKPQAAADVQRVPMEVIRQASLLLSDKNTAETLQQQQQQHSPKGTSSGAQQFLHGNTTSTHRSHFQESGTQLRIPSLQASSVEKKDSEGDSAGVARREVARALPDDTVAALSLCIDKMLHDHRKVLEGILKDEQTPSGVPPSAAEHSQKGGRGGAMDGYMDMVQNKLAGEENTALTRGNELVAATGKGHGNNSLCDLSDEEDELLLASRLQRKVKLMGHDIDAIEERHKQCQLSSCEDDGVNQQSGARAVAATKEPGRPVVSSGVRPSQKGTTRRRGEIPRAIVERIRSYQKENCEYISYTERLWNTSKVTEQVFAHRLTESLLEDALREVFDEVGGILDTYVEGLMHHELQ